MKITRSLVIGKKIYVIAGVPEHNSNTGRIIVTEYDTENGQSSTLGGEILGSTSGSLLGQTFEVNNDCTRIVAVDSSDESILVYDLVDGVWSAQTSLTKPTSALTYGKAISINQDGSIIAIAGLKQVETYNGGFVQVYNMAENTWTQLGSDLIDQNYAGESGSFGDSIDINNQGSYIIVGFPLSDSLLGVAGAGRNSINDSGSVQTFGYIDGDWQIDKTLTGERRDIRFGLAVRFFDSGSFVVLSAKDKFSDDVDGQIYLYNTEYNDDHTSILNLIRKEYHRPDLSEIVTESIETYGNFLYINSLTLALNNEELSEIQFSVLPLTFNYSSIRVFTIEEVEYGVIQSEDSIYIILITINESTLAERGITVGDVEIQSPTRPNTGFRLYYSLPDNNITSAPTDAEPGDVLLRSHSLDISIHAVRPKFTLFSASDAAGIVSIDQLRWDGTAYSSINTILSPTTMHSDSNPVENKLTIKKSFTANRSDQIAIDIRKELDNPFPFHCILDFTINQHLTIAGPTYSIDPSDKYTKTIPHSITDINGTFNWRYKIQEITSDDGINWTPTNNIFSGLKSDLKRITNSRLGYTSEQNIPASKEESISAGFVTSYNQQFYYQLYSWSKNTLATLPPTPPATTTTLPPCGAGYTINILNNSTGIDLTYNNISYGEGDIINISSTDSSNLIDLKLKYSVPSENNLLWISSVAATEAAPITTMLSNLSTFPLTKKAGDVRIVGRSSTVCDNINIEFTGAAATTTTTTCAPCNFDLTIVNKVPNMRIYGPSGPILENESFVLSGGTCSDSGLRMQSMISPQSGLLYTYRTFKCSPTSDNLRFYIPPRMLTIDTPEVSSRTTVSDDKKTAWITIYFTREAFDNCFSIIDGVSFDVTAQEPPQVTSTTLPPPRPTTTSTTTTVPPACSTLPPDCGNQEWRRVTGTDVNDCPVYSECNTTTTTTTTNAPLVRRAGGGRIQGSSISFSGGWQASNFLNTTYNLLTQTSFPISNTSNPDLRFVFNVRLLGYGNSIGEIDFFKVGSLQPRGSIDSQTKIQFCKVGSSTFSLIASSIPQFSELNRSNELLYNRIQLAWNADTNNPYRSSTTGAGLIAFSSSIIFVYRDGSDTLDSSYNFTSSNQSNVTITVQVPRTRSDLVNPPPLGGTIPLQAFFGGLYCIDTSSLDLDVKMIPIPMLSTDINYVSQYDSSDYSESGGTLKNTKSIVVGRLVKVISKDTIVTTVDRVLSSDYGANLNIDQTYLVLMRRINSQWVVGWRSSTIGASFGNVITSLDWLPDESSWTPFGYYREGQLLANIVGENPQYFRLYRDLDSNSISVSILRASTNLFNIAIPPKTFNDSTNKIIGVNDAPGQTSVYLADLFNGFVSPSSVHNITQWFEPKEIQRLRKSTIKYYDAAYLGHGLFALILTTANSEDANTPLYLIDTARSRVSQLSYGSSDKILYKFYKPPVRLDIFSFDNNYLNINSIYHSFYSVNMRYPDDYSAHVALTKGSYEVY
jgi:hypothetical protein